MNTNTNSNGGNTKTQKLLTAMIALQALTLVGLWTGQPMSNSATAAIPEPAMTTLLAISAFTLLSRRRRCPSRADSRLDCWHSRDAGRRTRTTIRWRAAARIQPSPAISRSATRPFAT